MGATLRESPITPMLTRLVATTMRTGIEKLVFPEGPRWHDGELWFSDMFGHRVCAVDESGTGRVIAEFPDDRPSGIGFLPDGSPIVALMRSRHVVRLTNGKQHIHADLSGGPDTRLNDMVVDDLGRAYVDRLRHPRIDSESDELVCIMPDGQVTPAPIDIYSPNGLAITADRGSLIVAETRRRRLTIVDIDSDGTLVNPRLYAETGELTPDGICLDAEGGVWFGGVRAGEFRRVLPGGAVTDRISVGDRWALACTLGGKDRRTLFMATTRVTPTPDGKSTSDGFIEMAEVTVPGSGWP
jgi:sugar lactone lactonase YvrE